MSVYREAETVCNPKVYKKLHCEAQSKNRKKQEILYRRKPLQVDAYDLTN